MLPGILRGMQVLQAPREQPLHCRAERNRQGPHEGGWRHTLHMQGQENLPLHGASADLSLLSRTHLPVSYFRIVSVLVLPPLRIV